MKKIILPLLFVFAASVAFAVENPKVGVKIPANTVLNERAQQVLTNKMQQLLTLNNVGSTDANARFVLTPKVSIVQSDIQPSAPPKQLVKLSIVLLISDNADVKTIVAQTEISCKGVGSNEAAAVLNAVQQIDVRSATLKRFMEQAKKKMAELPEAIAIVDNPLPAAPAEEQPAAEESGTQLRIESCHPDIIFSVTQCTKIGSTFLMKFTVQNQGSKDITNFSFMRYYSQVFDNEGNEYKIESLELGKGTISLPKGLKIKGELQIKNVDENAFEFVQMKLRSHSSSINLTSDFITIYHLPIVLK